VAGMAGVALGGSKLGAGAVLAQFLEFHQALVADLVSSAAALLALDHRHRLPVDGGHGFH
jgi:hypothetical protein